MPKVKTRKGASKRIKISANGKIMFRPAGKRHLNSGMSASRRRKKRKWKAFDGKHDAEDMRVVLRS